MEDSEKKSNPALRKIIKLKPDEDGDWYFNACVGNNTGTHDNAIGYSGGFQAAAEVMLRLIGVSKPASAHENWGSYPLVDMLVYPLCYCARHHVELALKRALPKAWAIFKIRSPYESLGLTEPRQTEITHSILTVWSNLHAICEKADQRLASLTSSLEPYIREIEEIDNSGQTFRYAVDASESKLHLEEHSHINLEFFANGYAELCAILENLEIHLQVIPEELSTGTFTSKLVRDQIIDIAKRLPNRDQWNTSDFDKAKNEIIEEYKLSSKDFQRACGLILEKRALSHLVGVTIPIIDLNKDTFVRLHEIAKGDSSAVDLSMAERSIIFGLLQVGSPMYYPEDFELFLRDPPSDEDEAAQFENERDPKYLARRVKNAPDVIIRALNRLGQEQSIVDFKNVFSNEIKIREGVIIDRKKTAEKFFGHESA